MKKFVAVLCMFAATIVLASCGVNPQTPLSSEQSSSSDISNASKSEDAAPVDKGSTTTTTTTTTTTDEDTTITSNDNSITEQEQPDEEELEREEPPTQLNTSLPDPPASLALKDLNYWEKADSFRVCHTQSPPFKAVTLKKGTEEYSTLLSLLQRVEGTYLGISHEGLAGGFMPIFVCQGTKEVDMIRIAISGGARFSTETQQEDSRKGLANKYASLYAMPEELSDEIVSFFESLEYTEDM